MGLCFWLFAPDILLWANCLGFPVVDFLDLNFRSWLLDLGCFVLAWWLPLVGLCLRILTLQALARGFWLLQDLVV